MKHGVKIGAQLLLLINPIIPLYNFVALSRYKIAPYFCLKGKIKQNLTGKILDRRKLKRLFISKNI